MEGYVGVKFNAVKRNYALPPDNEEKRRLGALWEKRSGGKCLFVMPRGKDFEAVKAKLAG